jgi:peptidoglycan/xylan/chitin deacetylase (PgdA/CDA1 family)
MKQRLRVAICVDDVHPQAGWRIAGDPSERWFLDLNATFGAKFTLFVPSNYHGRFPLSEHKDWVEFMGDHPVFELAAHGHYHMTTDPRKFGECEFFQINDSNVALERLKLLQDEWMQSLGRMPVGWRNPGWLCSYHSQVTLRQNFRYFALHYDHDSAEFNWLGKTFYGHDGIQQAHVGIHNGDMVMFQSHIAGQWNHNVWNEANYEQLSLSLEHLTQEYDCQFVTLQECL